MAGSRRTARSRTKSGYSDNATTATPRNTSGSSHRNARWGGGGANRDHGPLRLVHVSLPRLLLGLCLATFFFVAFFYYHYFHGRLAAPRRDELTRSVTPLDAPKMMDLPQFQGEHRESLYWGTYRPHVYLGIRARTPKSLVAGLMWLGIKDGQYFLRHVCQDSDDLRTYGWLEHNGRDYGRQLLVDHGLILTTSFLKLKGDGSGYGGDWAVRVNVESEKSASDYIQSNPSHLFFYIADEEGNPIRLGKQHFSFHGNSLLAFSSRKDVGNWELHMTSENEMDIHYSGFRTPHLHDLTELLQGTLASNARRTDLLQLPDTSEYDPNIFFFQVSTRLPSKIDISFLSATDMEGSNVERLNNLKGIMLDRKLEDKKKKYEEDYAQRFNLMNKVDSESMVVGKAALGNLLGGMGFFYGRSRIALPKGVKQARLLYPSHGKCVFQGDGSLSDFQLTNGENFISYWPASLFTAVPSRSFFPRGFLWDEGFHELLIWQWDADICLDIIGHWLDLINVDGWIPREQILGEEALSKVPEEFVVQYPTNANPPTLFLAIRDIINGMQENSYSHEQSIKISAFLRRAFVRLEAWFQWFNTTQLGKESYTYYWHGRDNITARELNPKTLMSGLDDYPRASHPSDNERHLDLRSWMLLAADCMQSIANAFDLKDSLKKGYDRMVQHLSDFGILNQMHLDNRSGAYFDFGKHTEKVRLTWYNVRENENIKRELLREVLKKPRLSLVPHIGYVSLFPFMMGKIPPESWILEKQLDLISNRSVLWTDYGLRSLSKTSSLYMKRNTEHDPPYWRGPIWINMNYMILSALHHYSKENGPYKSRAANIYEELRGNIIRNIVRNYHETGFLWEQYNQDDQGKGQRAHPFTGWTALVVLIMSESYPKL